ncbi:MAG TPA: amidohydrolase family protein [Polyangiaceae bacterium]|nr:amidohydrolase family protein [Polyangiaceae bacterium]
MGPLSPEEDPEGTSVDPDLPFVVDAHVHLFPDRVFQAIWRWFETHAWPIRYQLPTPEVIRFLLSRGVGHIVALHYAHAPGMARSMNRYISEICRNEPRVTGLATVLPGEPGAEEILEEAFLLGLSGVKLHCHVQCFSPDDEAMHAIYSICEKYDRPLVMHAGREPKSDGLKCDPYLLCSADRVDRALRDHPRLRLCVPHLGADEFAAYEKLLEQHDHLWLDTTMMLADYFPLRVPPRLLLARPERILYGTDFPILPYAWDRELRRLRAMNLGDQRLAGFLGDNARALFGIT